nr:uncharacterized protein LOC131780869 isoform X3 [Pocillopora verrucosa]
MWIQLLGFSCLLSFLEAEKNPSNFPECKVMSTVASHLKEEIKIALQKDAVCQRNIHCTGVNCTWSGGGSLEVDLQHCKDPVYYHLFLNVPSKGIRNKGVQLKQGKKFRVYNDPHIGEVYLHVKTLSRKENVITTNVVWEVCPPIVSCRTLTVVDKEFCVKMQSCPGFNTSTTHYKPCGTAPEPTDHPTGPHSEPRKRYSTGHPTGPHSEPRKRYSTGHPTGSHFEARKKNSTDDSSLSTAAIIGISAAGLVAILVVIGTVVYWKKYHHRSRLRAAYYNDISMHDPLYEDFGPEVA